MYRKYIYLYILIIIAFNILLFYNYKSVKETFGTINKGFNTFHVINILQRDDTIESLNNTRTECNKMGISLNKIEYGNNLIAIIENAINNNYKNTVVIETGFKFTQSKELIKKRLEEFLNRLGNDWDVLQLSSSTNTNENNTVNIYPGLDSVTNAPISGAYIINSSIFQKLKDSIINNNINNIQKESKWYLFNPQCGKIN